MEVVMEKTTRFSVALIALLVLLSVMTCTASAAPPAHRAKWTVMVYISGDNDLEWYVVSDIEDELAAIGSSPDVQVVALADRAPGYDTSRGDWTSTKLYHVTQGLLADSASAVEDWDERNMGDKQTLIEFVSWAKSNYPADHYALYFWGHGWNWQPGYVMQDDTSDDALEMEEVKAALPSLGFIDMVGFDGCNMAAIEVQMLWHGHATALSHSQEWVGGEGVQYDLVLQQLTDNPGMSADQVAVATTQSATSDKTWSAVAVDDRFDTLLNAVKQWSVALNNGLAANRKKYERAFSATRSFQQAPMDKDLYDMAYEVNRLVGDSNLKRKSQAVMNAVEEVVLYERHVKTYADAHGITIYHISRVMEKDSSYDYYRTLDFAQQTGWDEFLDAYAR
jgi:hypothetical protein